MDKYSNKEQLFLHLDGISIVPIIYSLDKIGIIDFIVKNQEFSIEDISKHFNINQGQFLRYINGYVRNWETRSPGIFYDDEIGYDVLEQIRLS